MPTVKKWLIVFVVILTIAGTGAYDSCGAEYEEISPIREEEKAGETAAAAIETVAESKVKGTLYATDKFSILVPDGWVTEDLSEKDFAAEDLAAEGGVGVAITKDKDFMLLAVLGGIPDAAAFSKKQVEENAELLNGTAVEEVTMFGIKFFKTIYTLDYDQTVFYGDRNGDVVMISMSGKDYQNNVGIKAMLDSIKFK